MLNDMICPKCGKLLGRVSGEAEIKCPRCKDIIHIDTSKSAEAQIKIVLNRRTP